jgi:SAM-dependent methyltransferase
MPKGEEQGPQREPVDRFWDDEGVIPKELGPDTEYLFARMTAETLGAVQACHGERVLDVGCGRGLDLASQAASGATLFGSDGSSVMIRRAAETFQDKGLAPRLACGSAERLPFSHASFHKVYCKGAIDHFYDPGEAFREMVRVLRPGGSLVVSVANFESLGHRMGRLYNTLHRIVKGREIPRPHFWEIPEDHTYRFDHALLMRLIPSELRLERDRGISLLWGFPRWGEALRRIPKGLSQAALRSLDQLARRAPTLADVLVVRAIRRQSIDIGQLKRSSPCRASSSSAGERCVGVGSGEGRSLDGEVSMKKYSRVQGLVICLATVLAAIFFLIGVFMKSYWALALPVAMGFLWLLGLAFWIGWTLLTIRVEPHQD